MKLYSLLLALGLSVSNYAADLSYDLNVTTWKQDTSLFGGKVSVKVNSNSYKTVSAGQLLVSFDDDETPIDQYVNPWFAYCTDVNNELIDGKWKPLSKEEAIASPQYQNPDWDGSLMFAYQLFATFAYSIDSDLKAVALQTAIWEALYDNQFDLNGGWFQAKDHPSFQGVTDLAQTFLYTPQDLLIDISDRNLVWWEPIQVNGSYRAGQGLISVPNPPNIIPESTTYLSILPLIGLAIYAYRKQRKIS